MLLLLNQAAAPEALKRISILVMAQPAWNRVSVPAAVRTAPELHHVRIYTHVRTADKRSLIHPDVLAGAAVGGAIVTHRGLPAQALSYNVRKREGSPASLDVTLVGRVALSGDLMLSVAAHGQAAVYGPFSGLTYTYEQTPTGWVTQATTADMSAADAEADSPQMTPFASEYLPWERERDLTPYQQALQARAEALEDQQWRLREREAKKAKRPFKRPERVDRRRVAVRDVIYHALSHLGIPFELTAEIPALGYYYATTETHLYWNGGMIIGTSYQTKGKTPVQVLEDILGPLGWRVDVQQGVARIGPPAELLGEESTPELLGVEPGGLTGKRQEIINPDAENGNGNRALPRSITVVGATLRRWLPPIPDDPEETEETPLPPEEPDDPEDPNYGGWPEPPIPDDEILPTGDPSRFAREKDATLYQRNVQRDGQGEPVNIKETWLYKRGGLLVLELSTERGWRRAEPGFYTDIKKPIERWNWGEINGSYTIYEYADQHYERACSGKVTRVWKWSPVGLRRYMSEQTINWQYWHKEGWLWWTAEFSDKPELAVADWIVTERHGSPFGKIIRQYNTKTLYYEYDSSTRFEQWLPIDETVWRHLILGRDWEWFAGRDPFGEAVNPQKVQRYMSDVELTDQGPPQAPANPEPEPEPEEPPEEEVPEEEGGGGRPDPENPAEDNPQEPPTEKERAEGFPYDLPISRTVYPGGRGAAVTIRVPTALSIPDVWFEQHVATLRRAQTMQRTTYSMVVPPAVETSSRIKEYSLSGSAGSLTAQVTVEERYVPEP